MNAEGGEIEAALKLNEQSLAEAMKTGDPEIIHNAEINLGENHFQMGHFSRATEVLENTWDQVKKPGISYARWRYKTRLFIALARVYGKTGERERALSFAGKGLKLARQTGARKHEAGALYAKAQILMKTRADLALKALREALAMSKEMGTRLLTERIERALKEGNRLTS